MSAAAAGPSSSHYELNKQELLSLAVLLDVIDLQNWESLKCAIVDNPAVFQSLARNVSRSSDLNGMTM